MGLFDRTKIDPARLPPGQIATEKWPVLTYGETPNVSTADWRLTFSGLVDEPVTITWAELLATPSTAISVE